jgi:hypothetical protein
MLWGAAGLPICTANYVQAYPSIISDGAGGAIIAWYDERFTGFTPDLYVQRRLSNGSLAPGFEDNGNTVSLARQSHGWPQLVPDGSGGAVMVYAESVLNGNRGLFSKHILPGGGIVPATDAGNTITPDDNSSFHIDINSQSWLIAPDGSGGAWVTWKQGIGDADPSIANIYLSRVLSDATVAGDFPVSGTLIRAGISKLGNDTCVIADGQGGAVVSWTEQYPGGFNLYAKRVTSTGTTATGWADTGTTVCSRQTVFGRPEMVADGTGGVYITWADGENFNEYPRISHLTASGQVAAGWAAEGNLPGPGTIMRYASRPRIVSDGANGAIVSWIDVRDGVNLELYAQRLNSNGSRGAGWPVEGQVLNNTHTIRLGEDDGYYETFTLVASPVHSAIATWRDYRNGTNPDNYFRQFENTLYAQRSIQTPDVPHMNVLGTNASGIASGSAATSAANGTDFGTITIGTSSTAHTFTIQNLGTANLTLTGGPAVQVTGAAAADFVVTQQPSTSVVISGSTTFAVRFAPSAAGVRNATVTIASNDSARNPYTFAISGTGATPNGPDLSGSFLPIEPSVCKTGSKGTQCKFKATFTVTNSGNQLAGPFTVRFFLSADATRSQDDLELKPLNVKKLNPAQAKTKKVNVKAPLNVQTAGMTLFAEIDLANTVAETNESNNGASAAVP